MVFHCALSQQRGPSAALRYIRARKRLLGVGGDDSGKDGKHSEESKQKVYILEGGFVKWQEKYVNMGQATSRSYEADVFERYGEDKQLTEDYQKDIWAMGY